MKKLLFTFLIACVATPVISQSSPTFSVIAAANSKTGWVYFKNPAVIDPATVFVTYKSNFGLGANDDMKFVKEETDNQGIKHTFYSQYYKSIKVEPCYFTVHSVASMADLATGSMCNGLSMGVTAAITTTDAVNYATAFLNDSIYMWQDTAAENQYKLAMGDVNATYYPTPNCLLL